MYMYTCMHIICIYLQFYPHLAGALRTVSRPFDRAILSSVSAISVAAARSLDNSASPTCPTHPPPPPAASPATRSLIRVYTNVPCFQRADDPRIRRFIPVTIDIRSQRAKMCARTSVLARAHRVCRSVLRRRVTARDKGSSRNRSIRRPFSVCLAPLAAETYVFRTTVRLCAPGFSVHRHVGGVYSRNRKLVELTPRGQKNRGLATVRNS